MVTFVDNPTENEDNSTNLIKLQNLGCNNATTSKSLDTISVQSGSSTGSTDSENLVTDGVLISPSQLGIPASGLNIINSTDVHLGDVVHNYGPVTINKQLTIKDLEANSDQRLPKYSIKNNTESDNCDNSLGNTNPSFVPENNCDTQIKTAKLDDGLFIITNKNIENCNINILAKKKPRARRKLIFTLSFSFCVVLIVGLIILYFSTTGPTPTPDNDTVLEKYGIVSRLQWSKQIVNDECPNLKLPVKLIIINHTALSNCSNYYECVQQCLIILNMHQIQNEWLDIGYNFLIGGDGSIYEGRGFFKEGSHTRYWNKKSLGIAFIGNFEEIGAPEKQIAAAQYLINIFVEMEFVRGDYKVLGALQLRPTPSPATGKLRSILLLASPFTLILLILILIGGVFLYKNIASHSGFRWRQDTDEQDKSTPIDGTNNTIPGPTKLRIVPRLEWLAQPPANKRSLNLPVPLVTILHTGTENCTTRAACIFQCRQLQTYHLESKNWWDIAYNFLVGGDGLVYEGRGWYVEGSHTYSYNAKSIGIAFIGTFNSLKPPEIQIKAARKLIKQAEEMHILTADYQIIGSKDVDATLSIGKELLHIIQKWPHYSKNGKLGSILLLTSPFTFMLLTFILIGGVFLYKNMVKWGPDIDEQDNTSPIDGTNNSAAGPTEFRIVPRKEWLAQPPKHKANDLNLPVPLVIILHTATENCSAGDKCIFQCRKIQTYHMESRNWWDIAYNFLIGGDGLVYEGRGWYAEGAHTYSYNPKSIGIAFIGTFNSLKPPEIQIEAARKLIKQAEEMHILTADYQIIGSRDVDATLSPGQELYNIIQKWPHYSNNIKQFQAKV